MNQPRFIDPVSLGFQATQPTVAKPTEPLYLSRKGHQSEYVFKDHLDPFGGSNIALSDAKLY